MAGGAKDFKVFRFVVFSIAVYMVNPQNWGKAGVSTTIAFFWMMFECNFSIRRSTVSVMVWSHIMKCLTG
jgi:hypothetical protein